MFILTVCCPILFLSLIWHRFDLNSRYSIRLTLWLSLSCYFTFYYVNGVDWSVYFLKFLGDDNPYLSFEFGFVLFFKALLFLTFEQFGLTILVFYLISFGFLFFILKRSNINEPFFLLCLLLIFGYTLLLEQLRQFVACIILLYAILNFHKGSSLKVSFFWIVIASTFHISSLILIPALILVSIRSVTLFVFFLLSSVITFVVILFAGYALIDALANYSFAIKKIAFYIQQTPLKLAFGWLNILDLIYIIFYCIYRKGIDRNSDTGFLARIVFVGAVIHLFSGSITFLARVTFIFYFIAIYTFSLSTDIYKKRLFSIKSYSSLMFSLFFSVFLFFNFLSYFRNVNSPIEFENLSFNPTVLFDNASVRALANKKFYDSMLNAANENK